jgi:hypothetical protein
LHLVIALADHESESIDEVWFGTTKVWTAADGMLSTQYSSYTAIYPHLGAADQEADANLMAAMPSFWTSAHRLRGVTYLYLRLSWNASAFRGFGPQNVWAVVKGKKLYDPRTGDTAWSANPALCVADYITSARHGLGASYATEVDTTILAASASICDESVSAGGVIEPRFTLNGLVGLDRKPIDVIGDMLGAMMGRVVFAGGKWRVIAAAWYPPADDGLDENDARAPFQLQNLLGRRNSYNAERGSYVNPDKQWQADTFPSVKVQDYIDDDGGETNWKPVTLPFTDSPTMAQRLCVIDLRRMRQPISLTYPAKLKAWRYNVGDVVPLTNARLGWLQKPFEVVNSNLVFEQAKDGPATLVGVDLDLRETAAAIYDDDVAITEKGDPAPNTTLPDVFNVVPPTNLRAAESLYSARDGAGVKAKWTISWDASPDAFVQSGGFYRPFYRAVGSTTWLPLPDTLGLSVDVLDIQPGEYEAAVEAHNYVGGTSPAVLLPPMTVAGLSATPTQPSGFTVAASNGVAIARWERSSDLDVLEGGAIVFRHSPAMTGAAWDGAVSIADPMAGNLSSAVLPLKAGTYLAKFRDASGNYSTGFASFSQSQVSQFVFTTLGSAVEDPAFSGVTTDMTVASSTLALATSGGVSVPSGTYDFANKIDLGSVRASRVTGAITAQVSNLLDTVDGRTALVDSWPSWDGDATGNEADAVLYIASTNDDPNGASPTWSAWQRLDVNDFRARGFKFQLRAESLDPSFTITVTALEAVAEGV